MKRIRTLWVAVLCALALPLGAFASADMFAVKTAIITPPEAKQCNISIAGDTVLEFAAADLEKRLGLGSGELRGVTVTTLPDPMQGALILHGVEVERYQYLSREEIDELCFVPGEGAVTAGLTLLPQGLDAVSTDVVISVLGEANHPPVIESASFNTVKNTRLTGAVVASDPEGDAISIQVVLAPGKGAVTFDGLRFVYEPFQGETGRDSFVVCAVDRFGNYSAEAKVEIKIENNRSGFRFTDMNGNASEYAAYKLHEQGVLSGEQIGRAWLFHPDQQVTRGEFLVMLLAATGMDGSLTATVNTRLEGDEIIPMWLKPYVKKALDEGIWDEDRAFLHDEVPTRAEAVLLTDLAAKISDVKDYDLTMADLADIPAWALPAYKDLAAYRMLDLHDGSAHPDRALDNAYAADLLWQLYKHTHR